MESGRATRSLPLVVYLIPVVLMGGVSAQSSTKAAKELSLTCSSSSGMMHLCTLWNWNLALRTEDQVLNGIALNITPPSISHRARVSVVCDGSALQTVSQVTLAGYNSCNATTNQIGKIYKNSGVAGPGEVTTPSCYFNNPETLTVSDFMYSDNIQDTYYIIGTIGVSSARTQFTDINNQTGGACTEGLRARIIVNWSKPPTSGSGAGTSPRPSLPFCLLAAFMTVSLGLVDCRWSKSAY